MRSVQVLGEQYPACCRDCVSGLGNFGRMWRDNEVVDVPEHDSNVPVARASTKSESFPTHCHGIGTGQIGFLGPSNSFEGVNIDPSRSWTV